MFVMRVNAINVEAVTQSLAAVSERKEKEEVEIAVRPKRDLSAQPMPSWQTLSREGT